MINLDEVRGLSPSELRDRFTREELLEIKRRLQIEKAGPSAIGAPSADQLTTSNVFQSDLAPAKHDSLTFPNQGLSTMPILTEEDSEEDPVVETVERVEVAGDTPESGPRSIARTIAQRSAPPGLDWENRSDAWKYGHATELQANRDREADIDLKVAQAQRYRSLAVGAGHIGAGDGNPNVDKAAKNLEVNMLNNSGMVEIVRQVGKKNIAHMLTSGVISPELSRAMTKTRLTADQIQAFAGQKQLFDKINRLTALVNVAYYRDIMGPLATQKQAGALETARQLTTRLGIPWEGNIPFTDIGKGGYIGDVSPFPHEVEEGERHVLAKWTKEGERIQGAYRDDPVLMFTNPNDQEGPKVNILQLDDAAINQMIRTMSLQMIATVRGVVSGEKGVMTEKDEARIRQTLPQIGSLGIGSGGLEEMVIQPRVQLQRVQLMQDEINSVMKEYYDAVGERYFGLESLAPKARDDDWREESDVGWRSSSDIDSGGIDDMPLDVFDGSLDDLLEEQERRRLGR